jgi:hypothetical protein
MSTHDAIMGGKGSASAEVAFEDRVVAEIVRLDAEAWEEDLRAGVRRAAARARVVSQARRSLVGWGIAAAFGGLLAGALAWILWPRSPAEEAGRDGFAFDGGLVDDGAPRSGAEVVRDARGRIAEIRKKNAGELDGERLLFRSGRLIRTEQWRAGRLDGVTVDYDAHGRVVATESWVGGEARGPWTRFDAEGKVEATGNR